MNAKTDLNIESIVWVKNEIDKALELVRQQLGNYWRNPDDITQIKACRDHIHEINGVIKILGLNGVATISQQMEKLIDVFVGNESKPDLKLDLFS
ncbi:MAG: Hpt domain-containing protein, partial [Nitrosomonadaceae bacterium]|nr:Hpt domain-containing protein [Nitrosomonadaceae bacterium]